MSFESGEKDLRIRHLEERLREGRLEGGVALLLFVGMGSMRGQTIGELPALPLMIGVVAVAVAAILWRHVSLERRQLRERRQFDASRNEAIEAELALFPRNDPMTSHARAAN